MNYLVFQQVKEKSGKKERINEEKAAAASR